MADTINLGKIKGETGSGSTTVVGTILPWSQATAPDGFLKCDGSAISRSTYSALFEVIGTTYGVGDGSTTFNLPELTSRTMVQANTSTNVGQTSGLNKVTPTLNQNLSATAPAVTGAVTANVTGNVAAGVGNLATNAATLTGNVTSALGTLAKSTTINGAPTETQNLAAAVTQNLAGSSAENFGGNLTGGVSNHTLSLAQIPSHSHPQGSNTGKRGFSEGGPHARPGNTGAAGSNQAHGHNHNFAVAISGNVDTSVTGAVGVNLTGNVATTLGTLAGNSGLTGAPGITQNLGVNAANLTGAPSTTQNLGTSVTQNLAATAPQITGTVASDQISLFQPHLVVIYIIKT